MGRAADHPRGQATHPRRQPRSHSRNRYQGGQEAPGQRRVRQGTRAYRHPTHVFELAALYPRRRVGGAGMNALHDRVMKGLEEVIDPCSVTAGGALRVVDMGFLTEMSVDEDGAVRVSMRATSAMCTMIAGIMKVAEDRLAGVEGVTRVEIKLCSGAIWTEGAMTERGRQALAARRERSRTEVGVRPQEGKTRQPRSAAPSEAPSSRA